MPKIVTERRETHESASRAPAKTADLRLSEIIAALSYALDLTEGQPEGHAIRSCLIGMRVAKHLGLNAESRSALFYALLLKDLGCSSNAARLCELFGADDLKAKCNLKTVDWTKPIQAFRYAASNVAPGGSLWRRLVRLIAVGRDGSEGTRRMFATRCQRGADIARLLEFPEETAQAILHLDEHWDGLGHPQGLRGKDISLLGRILGLSQTVEVFFTRFGPSGAVDVVKERRGTWFDPQLADILLTLKNDWPFWLEVAQATDHKAILRHEPEELTLTADETRLDRVAEGFARVVDAKSPWTYRHSEGVAVAAVGIAEVLGFPPEQLRQIRRAGLLHDLGKLGVSNLILDKPGRLTDAERLIIQKHPGLSEQILRRVAPFEELADWAWAHHERIDGRGYPRGLTGDQLPTPVRVLVVADIFDAVSAARPYRGEQPLDKVLDILRKDAGTAVCPTCVEALETYLERRDTTAPSAILSSDTSTIRQ